MLILLVGDIITLCLTGHWNDPLFSNNGAAGGHTTGHTTGDAAWIMGAWSIPQTTTLRGSQCLIQKSFYVQVKVY